MILEKRLEEAILSFNRKMMEEIREQAIASGFNISQLEVLHYVKKEGNPTMKCIADRLRITPSSTTTIIDYLYEKGLLKREFDEKDRRIIRIVATPKTLELFDSFKNKKITTLQKLFSKLSDKNKEQLIDIINAAIKE